EYVRDTMNTNLSKASTGAPRRANVPPPVRRAPAGDGGVGSGIMGLICFGIVAALGIWLVIGLIRAFTGSMGGGGYGSGGGYGPVYGGGGGFMSGLMGGLFGAAAGSFLYDR